ncbi:FAD-dependent oxidoreductase [Thermoplasmatales archaeon AK]|nr:FAD-dependent oxidoreductase [Thermoplasmatales archaeon AK]
MAEFDVIVVGGGPAGASAAIMMAKNGINVLLVEKADPPGSKNVSGGVLWGHDLDDVIPDWEKSAPLERYVKAKAVGFLTNDSLVNLEFRSRLFDQKKSGYTVLRARLDQFLVKKAKDVGATVVTGVTVDKVAFENGKVKGIEQDGDIITSDGVLLAEGANPRVAIDSGLRPPLSDRDVAIGVKQVIKLPEKTINERFNLREKEGFAGEYVLGYLPDTVEAGGFLYTNKDTISVGVVVSMKHLRENNATYSFNIIDEFVNHPAIAPLLEGGTVDEYSAHLVQEGGLKSIPKLFGNGYLIAGDAAGFSFSNGMVLQGMNYAIASGKAAAQTFTEAYKRKDYSESVLESYRSKLMDSYVLRDMYNFSGIDEVTWSKLVHKTMPKLMENVMSSLFLENGKPKEHIIKLILKGIKSSDEKPSRLVSDGVKMLRRM